MKKFSRKFAAGLLIVLASVSTSALIGVLPVYALREEIIVDDVNAVFVGYWSKSTLVPGYYGVMYRVHGAGNGSNTATWPFTIPTAGSWHVFAQWSNRSTRASDAKYTINHAAGATVVTVNQQINGGSWQSLGTFDFEAATYSVVLSDDANAYVIADAIRVSPADMWSETYGGIGDDAGTGETVQTSDGGFAISGDTNSFGMGGMDFWLVKTDVSGSIQWNKTYGGVLDETIGEMCQTTDGGYALAGSTESFGAGGADFWLVKTGADGRAYWAKSYGGPDFDYAMSIVQTPDRGYALFGVTESFGAGGQDFYLVKTDAAGNMEWSKTYGGNGTDYGTSVVQSSDGGYALAGYTNSFGAGNNDFWLVKTDPSGNMQWNKTYGGADWEGAYQLRQTGDGGYAMIGLTSASGMDVYLVKTDAAGNMQWNMTYGGTGMQLGNSLIQTLDQGYAITGRNFVTGGSQDMLLIKTDSSGHLQWNMTYGGTGAETGYSVIQIANGGYVLTGVTTSYGAGGQDFYFVKTNELGVVPEGLTVGVMVLLSTVAVIVATSYFRKATKMKKTVD